jgi:hypothetical protein
VTNVGCNTISHWCTIEHWTTLLLLVLGSVFYALVISNVSSIVSASASKKRFKEKYDNVKAYMAAKKLPMVLQDRVRDFYHIQYSGGEVFEESRILSELTPALREEIHVFNRREVSVAAGPLPPSLFPRFRSCREPPSRSCGAWSRSRTRKSSSRATTCSSRERSGTRCTSSRAACATSLRGTTSKI